MLSTIRIQLARNPGHPDGDPACGYEFRAPLDAGGRLDAEAFRRDRKACTVRRFWKGEPDQTGELHHTRHGSWAFSYQPGEDDDEPLYRLETHRMAPGEYVTIREADGETLTFRIESVVAAH